jgi:hypothetical protein
VAAVGKQETRIARFDANQRNPFVVDDLYDHNGDGKVNDGDVAVMTGNSTKKLIQLVAP